MDKAFFDTGIAIAYVFYINSLHSKAKDAFNTYSKYYWSANVDSEFDNRYYEKMINLSEFFRDLKLLLENPTKDLYSPNDLSDFALKNYSDRKKDDAKSSIEPFWNRYIGFESQVLFYNMVKAINFCLKDLAYDSTNNKNFLKGIMQLTPPRFNQYSAIDSMLKSEGIDDADRNIVLDGHDFACHSNYPIDFVTFDRKFCDGARNVKILCFNSIKGKDDFKAS